MFPSAEIRLIKQQRMSTPADLSSGQALIKGKRTLMIGQTSQFVGNFDGRLGQSVRCCPYYKLIPLSNGCPYYCTYCYLAFVYRKFASFIKLNINYDTMFRQVRRAAAKCTHHADFNMGEMLDSLALDHITDLTKKLVPLFADIPNANLMLLTKSSNIDNLLSVPASRNTVVSWSLNSHPAIEEYELGTATLDERIQSASKCREHGFRIRFRIDPGILHADWKSAYCSMISQALAAVRPENITLGMLRLVPGHKQLACDAYGEHSKPLQGQNLGLKYSDGKSRYADEDRIEFYMHLIDCIKSIDKDVPISLCRETPWVWQAVGQLCQPGNCNCVNQSNHATTLF
jgi:spore photoproduct lyase